MIDKQKYIKWYQDFVVPAIDDEKIAPTLSNDEILTRDLISNDGWMLVPSYDLINKEIAKNAPRPNIYFQLEETYMGIGIAYNTVGAVDGLLNILNNYCFGEQEELVSSLKELDDEFRMGLDRKTLTHFQASPEYERVEDIQCNEISKEFFEQIIKKAREIREEGKNEANEKGWRTPRLFPSFGIAQAEFDYLDEEVFSESLRSVKRVFQVAYNIKSTSEIKKGKKEIENDIGENRAELYRLNNLLKLPYPEEKITQIKQKIANLENENKELEKRL